MPALPQGTLPSTRSALSFLLGGGGHSGKFVTAGYTGGALAAFLALLGSVCTLGFAWYLAAVNQMELADTKAGAAAQKEKTAKVKDLLGKALSSGGQKITSLPDDVDQAENVFQQPTGVRIDCCGVRRRSSPCLCRTLA
jgi:hypothetical protein